MVSSLDALCGQEMVVALFHAGKTAGGHHWTVEDAQGEVLATTRRVHSGGRLARAAWKAVTLTGMDAGNDIHVELVGTGDAVLARLESANAKPATVTVTGPAGEPVVTSTRADGVLTLDSGATMPTEGDSPWTVTDAAGRPLGELLAGEPGPSTTMSVWEMLIPYAPNMSSDYAKTMHLGLRRVLRYAFRPEGRPDPGLALLPLLAGLTY